MWSIFRLSIACSVYGEVFFTYTFVQIYLIYSFVKGTLGNKDFTRMPTLVHLIFFKRCIECFEFLSKDSNHSVSCCILVAKNFLSFRSGDPIALAMGPTIEFCLQIFGNPYGLVHWLDYIFSDSISFCVSSSIDICFEPFIKTRRGRDVEKPRPTNSRYRTNRPIA